MPGSEERNELLSPGRGLPSGVLGIWSTALATLDAASLAVDMPSLLSSGGGARGPRLPLEPRVKDITAGGAREWRPIPRSGVGLREPGPIAGTALAPVSYAGVDRT